MTEPQKKPSRRKVGDASDWAEKLRYWREVDKTTFLMAVLANKMREQQERISKKFDTTVEEKKYRHALGYEQGKRFSKEK